MYGNHPVGGSKCIAEVERKTLKCCVMTGGRLCTYGSVTVSQRVCNHEKDEGLFWVAKTFGKSKSARKPCCGEDGL